jgi:plastocyanin
MQDDIAPAESSGSAQINSHRVSRRGFALGLAVVGGMAAIGRTTFGHQAASNSPGSSPVASPVASPGATPAAAAMVTIANFSFTPAILQVSVGSEVTWVNTDSVAHTVTSDDKTTFSSPPLQQNDHFSFRFTATGTFAYHCSIHPSMTAQVIVS